VQGKISSHVDEGLSGGSSLLKPGSEDPHRHERKFLQTWDYIFGSGMSREPYKSLGPSSYSSPPPCSQKFDKLKFVFVRRLPSCALKTLSVFTSERVVFIACLLLSEYSFERLYHIANFEHDQLV
jgi:hypothetical protein